MGGDTGPHLTVPSALSALHQHPQLRIQLFGDEALLVPHLARSAPDLRARIDVVHCSETVAMDEKPAEALRRKRDSSLWRALEAVASGTSSACVSAGNTGALMAMGMALVGRLQGIERPAICTALPTCGGRAYLLDMGANLGCDAAQLVQFAHMASAMVQVVDAISHPRVGLLNIGQEQGKGDAVVREAAARLVADKHINYQGFVEGDGIYSGDFDIIVCDGFVGNVALKSSEGVAKMLTGMLRASLKGSLAGRLGALLARRPLARFASGVDPSRYNGASLLGLDRVVVKSHGGASQAGFEQAISVAVAAAREELPQRIATRLAALAVGPEEA